MADDKKEQLKIEAELDTSKLKQEARQGLQTVTQEAKKVETQANQTSKAVDNVGRSLQQAGQSGTRALREVGQEAEKATQKINEIAKATKAINLRQAIGVASQILGSDSVRTIGGAVGRGMGMDDDSMSFFGGYASSVLGGASSGAMLGSALPGVGTGIGAAAGALTGAASYLIKSAIEMENAADAVRRSAEERIKANASTTEQIDKTEAEEKRVTDFVTKFQDLIKNGDFSGAGKLLDREERRASRDKTAANFLLHSNITQSDDKAYQEAVGDFNRAKTDLTRVSQLRGVLNNAQNAAQNAASARNAREVERARAEAEAKAREDYNRQKAFDSYTIEQKREKITDIQNSQLKPLESLMSGMSSFKLSDSLTQIGGGSGYGVQMQGINRYVSNISNNIQTIKGIIQKELDAIKELSDKYKPYYGEFMSQQDN